MSTGFFKKHTTFFAVPAGCYDCSVAAVRASMAGTVRVLIYDSLDPLLNK